jgi:hypothetical protein
MPVAIAAANVPTGRADAARATHPTGQRRNAEWRSCHAIQR